MLVINGKEVLKGRKGHELIERNKQGDVVRAHPLAVAARELLVPRTHKGDKMFRLGERARAIGF